jgi:hypothetical protein
MAVISHKNITDPQIHEPKGISAANAGEVYVANGSGSGSWVAQGEIDGHTALVDDVENQGPLTGGADITPKDLGTITTGTVTVDPGDRGIQFYTNNGAHTLAEMSSQGAVIVQITNGASAGAITTSGWDIVTGDPFTTTNTHKFLCIMVKVGSIGWLNVLAGQ